MTIGDIIKSRRKELKQLVTVEPYPVIVFKIAI